MYQVYQVVYNSSEDGRGPNTRSALFSDRELAEDAQSKLDPYYRSSSTIDTLNVWESAKDGEKERIANLVKHFSADEMELLRAAVRKGEL